MNLQQQQKQIQFIAAFKDNKSYLLKSNVFKQHISSNNIQSIFIIVSSLKKILTLTSFNPESKFLALRLLKQNIQSYSFCFLKLIQSQILPILYCCAQYKKQSADELRGKQLFLFSNIELKKKQQYEQLGMSFLKLVLQLIKTLSQVFVHNSNVTNYSSFCLCFNKLNQMGVSFPNTNQMKYFKYIETLRLKNQYQNLMANKSQQQMKDLLKMLLQNMTKHSINYQILQVVQRVLLTGDKYCIEYFINICQQHFLQGNDLQRIKYLTILNQLFILNQPVILQKLDKFFFNQIPNLIFTQLSHSTNNTKDNILLKKFWCETYKLWNELITHEVNKKQISKNFKKLLQNSRQFFFFRQKDFIRIFKNNLKWRKSGQKTKTNSKYTQIINLEISDIILKDLEKDLHHCCQDFRFEKVPKTQLNPPKLIYQNSEIIQMLNSENFNTLANQSLIIEPIAEPQQLSFYSQEDVLKEMKTKIRNSKSPKFNEFITCFKRNPFIKHSNQKMTDAYDYNISMIRKNESLNLIPRNSRSIDHYKKKFQEILEQNQKLIQKLSLEQQKNKNHLIKIKQFQKKLGFLDLKQKKYLEIIHNKNIEIQSLKLKLKSKFQQSPIQSNQTVDNPQTSISLDHKIEIYHQNDYKFRKFLLRSKNSIYQNNLFSVGIISQQKNQDKLNLNIYCTFKYQLNNFQITISQNSEKKSNPKTITNTKIQKQYHVSYQLHYKNYQIIPILSINYSYQHKNEKVQFPLPISLHNFVKFYQIQKHPFLNEFKVRASQIKESQLIQYCTKIIKNSQMLLKYFPEMILLEEIKNQSCKYGIQISYRNCKYLFQFIIYERDNILFIQGLPKSSLKSSDSFIQEYFNTMIIIFKKQKK